MLLSNRVLINDFPKTIRHLNMGKWGDSAIVSKEWIEETFCPYIEINLPFYSCYQWQMVETDLGFNVWFIPGNGGQIINISIEDNLHKVNLHC